MQDDIKSFFFKFYLENLTFRTYQTFGLIHKTKWYYMQCFELHEK